MGDNRQCARLGPAPSGQLPLPQSEEKLNRYGMYSCPPDKRWHWEEPNWSAALVRLSPGCPTLPPLGFGLTPHLSQSCLSAEQEDTSGAAEPSAGSARQPPHLASAGAPLPSFPRGFWGRELASAVPSAVEDCLVFFPCQGRCQRASDGRVW